MPTPDPLPPLPTERYGVWITDRDGPANGRWMTDRANELDCWTGDFFSAHNAANRLANTYLHTCYEVKEVKEKENNP